MLCWETDRGEFVASQWVCEQSRILANPKDMFIWIQYSYITLRKLWVTNRSPCPLQHGYTVKNKKSTALEWAKSRHHLHTVSRGQVYFWCFALGMQLMYKTYHSLIIYLRVLSIMSQLGRGERIWLNWTPEQTDSESLACGEKTVTSSRLYGQEVGARTCANHLAHLWLSLMKSYDGSCAIKQDTCPVLSAQCL